MRTERKYWFSVVVVNKAGVSVTMPQFAHTSYEAKQLVYAKLCAEQPDLTKYKALTKGLS